jgi:hypothetical protein
MSLSISYNRRPRSETWSFEVLQIHEHEQATWTPTPNFLRHLLIPSHSQRRTSVHRSEERETQPSPSKSRKLHKVKRWLKPLNLHDKMAKRKKTQKMNLYRDGRQEKEIKIKIIRSDEQSALRWR